MFQLFKDRNFNDYLNDTFQFFRLQGKHFFKLYFVINGGLLLIASVFIYFFSKMYFEFLTSVMNGNAVGPEIAGNYFNENFGVFITMIVAAILFFIVISMLQFAFPVVYLDLYDSKKGADFTVQDVLNALKKKLPKILKFIIGCIFIIFPITIILMGLNMLLCFIIIGFPLFLISFPAIVSWVNLSFYYYMNSEEGFFSAIGDGFDTIKGQFWPIVLSTLVIFIIYYVGTTVITMIPYFIGIASMFTSLESGDTSETFSKIAIMVTVVMVVSIIVNYILNNLVLINQGMIYYSHIENTESSVSNNSIDLIGTDSE